MSLKPPIELLKNNKTPEDHVTVFEPQNFDQYLGQAALKKKLHVYVKAAKLRNEALDHVLFFGPAGLGKTTIAKVIANELATNLKITSAPIIERSGDLVAMLSDLAPKEVFFIDEIHRLPKNVEEILYTAMENFCIDIMVGQGTGAKSVRLPLNPFTLIGATTKASLISRPLRTRFGIVERLNFYESKDLADIAIQNAQKLNLTLTTQAALDIGSRARGTPRIVKRILKRIRDFAQVNNHTTINQNVVQEAFTFLDIDEQGLTPLDNKLLTIIIQDFNGGPVGLETLAALTGEDKETIEDVCEPFLIRQGFLQKTPRGRQVPPKKILHLRKKIFGQNMIFGNTNSSN